jgi:hypothetical protein
MDGEITDSEFQGHAHSSDMIGASKRLAQRDTISRERARLLIFPVASRYAAGGTEIFTDGRSSAFW